MSESPSEQATEQFKTVAGSNSQILLLQKRQDMEHGQTLDASLGSSISNYHTWRTEILIRKSPVYIENMEGKERIVYNRKEMQSGKLYKITWAGQRWALRKNADGVVDLYEFESDK